jgi:hypothetical protein
MAGPKDAVGQNRPTRTGTGLQVPSQGANFRPNSFPFYYYHYIFIITPHQYLPNYLFPALISSAFIAPSDSIDQ